MTTFILCWHKTEVIEEIKAATIDQNWYVGIAHGDLDVLTIKDGKAHILDSAGGWSRVKKANQAGAGTATHC